MYSFVAPLSVSPVSSSSCRTAFRSTYPLCASASSDHKRGLPKSSRRKVNRSRSRSRTRSTSRSRAGAAHPVNDKWDRVQPVPRRPQSVSVTTTPQSSDLRPENCPALVLNADYSPLSYMPLSLWPWQDVVKAVFLDRVTVVETYDVGVRSPGMMFPLPSVVSLKEYQPVTQKKPPFTRFNVFLRDEFACQYCGGKFPTQDLTFDHVTPRCLGGKTNWTNVVTACVKCNHAKGRKLLRELKGVRLLKKAVEPTNQQLQVIAKKFPPRYLHESWRDYVYWSQSMEVEADAADSNHNSAHE